MSNSPEQARSGLGETREVPSTERTHATNEHELVAASMHAKLALAEALKAAPERAVEIETLRNKLDSLIKEAQETLKTLGRAAAIGAVLSTGALAETPKSPEPKTIAESLVDNPEKAEQLLEGVVVVAGSAPSGSAEHMLAQEAKEVLREIPTKKHTGQKLAFSIAERVAKICLDLAGLGAVSHALDLIEDCTRVFLESRRKATA